MKFSARGFTLIELLVVITVLAITGIFVLANYRSFGEDQNLKNALLDIQSQLRTAQTNATTNVVCGNQYSTTWQVEFANSKTINLRCPASPEPIKRVTLGTNIAITQGTSCPSIPPFTVDFAPITGKINLGSNCTIAVRNDKTNSFKYLKIDKGGNIYETSAP